MKSDPRFSLVQLPEAKWNRAALQQANKPLRTWFSRVFQVTLWQEKNGQLRLSINRTAKAKKYDWKDGITWDELQRLKSAAGFGNWQAVEIYPPDAQIVYKANVRHLWLMHQPLSFAWKSGT